MKVPERRRLAKRIPRIALGDVIAGVSMAAVLVPQALAYARLAGVPAYLGLYAASLPLIAAAFFASSPYLQTGPAAVTAMLTAGALAVLAAAGTQEYILLASLLAVLVGLMRIGIGLIRLGPIVYLMSEPVLRGFTTGAALLIVLSQVPVVLGIGPSPSAGIPATLVWIFSRLSAWRGDSMLLAIATFAIVSGARRVHPFIPGVLIAAVGGILYSVLADYGGPVMGAVPATLPRISVLLPWASVPSLVLPAVVIALVGFSETASIGRMYAARERQRWDPDREFISQGVANFTAGLSGGFPVGGSFSRSSLAHQLGARTRWSGAITGVTVLAFLPLAAVLAPLPNAVLGAMVIGGVVRLVRLRPIASLWRLSRPQFLVAAGTLMLTVALSPRIDEAVLLGILFAVAVHLWREFNVKLTSWIEEDALHVRPEGVLWFGSAQMLEKQVLELLAEHRGTGRLVLHMERLGRVDLTASLVLETLVTEARAAGLAIEIVAIHPTTARALRRVLRRAQPAAAGAVAEDPGRGSATP